MDATDSAGTASASRLVFPGQPHPLGATLDEQGANFAVFSERATAIFLSLFDDTGNEERIPMVRGRGHVWHLYVPGIEANLQYGFRVDGPYDPGHGLRFNVNKLLVDPYARAIAREVDWTTPVFGYDRASPDVDLSFDVRDNAAGMPHSVVIDTSFNWELDHPLRTPWKDSVIYELHVKGFTKLHPDIPEELRGTFTGLAHPAAIDHLKHLGITAVELLPVQEIVDEPHLIERGLTNYWGYNPLNYFAPTARYASRKDPNGVVREFKEMVKALHRAGIEVILDVVYNHTGEGDELGPTLSLRGIDNTSYYRLAAGRERYYVDYTGTGNSLNVRHPQVLKLIMDSLRYWVTEMHVDGFRFDLASTLARELHDVDRLAAFFDIIHQDPILAQVKLIAEPWDVGEGGYQVGNFPTLWAEWNGKYRDTVRRFWRGDPNQIDDLAYRLTGSSDLFDDDGRWPLSSINFVTAHDGFSLTDLVSYNEKHNEANGEGNRDGTDENFSWNHGVEGPTNDERVLAARERDKRNLLATLLLSQGVPMLLNGDEMGRTRHGNNNPYCQDNETSWLSWSPEPRDRELLRFTRRLIEIRRTHPALRRQTFFRGQKLNGSNMKDITWLRPDGSEMSHDDWLMANQQCIGALIAGDGLIDVNAYGTRLADDTLLLLLNASGQDEAFRLPCPGHPGVWDVIVDTAEEYMLPDRQWDAGATDILIPHHSLILLKFVQKASM